jgi:hypothetical protein
MGPTALRYRGRSKEHAMSQVLLPRPTSGDTPPRTLPDELVKALQTDAFQHFLEHEAEKRILVVRMRPST